MKNRVTAAYNKHLPVKSYLIDWYKELLPEKVDKMVEFGFTTQSAKFWRELYQDAIIVLVDQAKNFGPSCDVIYGDYTDPRVVEQVSGFSPYRLMIDDANHEIEYQKKGLELYWKQLAIGGMYIVEDIIGKASFEVLVDTATSLGGTQIHRWDPKGHGEGGEFVLFITKEKK